MTTSVAEKTPRPAPNPPPWLGIDELRRLLPASRAVEAVEEALRRAGSAAATGHLSLACDVERGAFHVKATALASPSPVFAAKINANFPHNPEAGLPTIQGVVALFDAVHGRLLALLDSPALTALRTGAATAVAARYLARPDSTSCLICGGGRQAFEQVEALIQVLPLRRLAVFDLDAGRASRLAARVAAELGLAVETVASLDPAAPSTDVIVTCTTARQPFLFSRHVAAGTFVAAVGADHPSKQELDPGLLAVARCFVDSVEQALACGELHHAVEAGVVTATSIAGRLDQLVGGAVVGRRTPAEITLFDSTGIAIEDAATALAAYEAWCRSRGPGDL